MGASLRTGGGLDGRTGAAGGRVRPEMTTASSTATAPTAIPGPNEASHPRSIGGGTAGTMTAPLEGLFTRKKTLALAWFPDESVTTTWTVYGPAAFGVHAREETEELSHPVGRPSKM